MSIDAPPDSPVNRYAAEHPHKMMAMACVSFVVMMAGALVQVAFCTNEHLYLLSAIIHRPFPLPYWIAYALMFMAAYEMGAYLMLVSVGVFIARHFGLL